LEIKLQQEKEREYLEYLRKLATDNSLERNIIIKEAHLR
jgi:hypothetical protein